MLTNDQKRILLQLCNAAESGKSVRLRATRKIRETATACALVRKGFARRNQDGRFEATIEGYWLGDGLRIWERSRGNRG